MAPEPTESIASQREAKAAIRKRVRESLAAMPSAELADRSRRACQRVMSSAYFACARTVLLYAPLPGELDVTSLILDCLAQKRTVCLPRVDWARIAMTPAKIDAFPAGLVETKFGVREPGSDAPAVDVLDLDLVVVPGLAFDLRGGRLGRGAGFYDRFLADQNLKAITIGVALDAQIVADLPMRSGAAGTDPDARMDAVLTETRIVLGV